MKKISVFLSVMLFFTCLFAVEIDESYKIAVSDKQEVQDVYAAQELAKYLSEVIGSNFTVVKESELSAGNTIYVGNTKFSKGGNFAPDEFRIYLDGKNVVIAGSPQRGVLFGVYEFLERFADVRFFTPECELVPKKKTLNVPDKTDIRHKSAFEFRYIYAGKRTHNTTPFFRKMRLSGWGGDMKYGSSARFGTDGHCHTYFKYSKDFPQEISWADAGGKRHIVKNALNGSICFSHPEVLKRFVERLKKNIASDREKAAKQNLPPPEYYSVSQNDCDSACGCAECKKFIQKYGVSGLVIDFTNRIAAEITKDYPDIKIQIFAYFDSLDIPKNAIKPHKNVIVQISTYTKKFRDHLRSVNDPVNKQYVKLLADWKKSADSLGIWDYWRYFSGFKPSAPAALILSDNINAYKNNNVVMFFTEYETAPKDLLSFYDLSFYVGARLLDDPSKNVQTMVDEFAEAYYGAAAPAMKKLLIVLTEAVKKDKNCGEYLHFAQRAYMKDAEFFRQAFALIDEAEKAVANDPEKLTRVWQEKLLLESAYLKAWNSHKNKLKLDRKKLQESISKMLYPVLRSFFDPSILSKKVVDDADRFYAEKVVFDKTQNIKAVPVTDFAQKHPQAKIIEIGKISCSSVKVNDADSPYGRAFSHSGKYSAKQREERHKRQFIFGMYEKSYTKYLVHGSIAPNVIPQDEKYHWYYAGTTRMYNKLSLWLHWTWGMSVSLGKYYDENNPDKKYAVYFLIKHQGSAYVKDSKSLNDIRLAAIALEEVSEK